MAKEQTIDFGFEQALDIAIKALEQEPCEDAISRQAVLDVLRTMYDTHIVELDNGDEYIDYNDTVYEIEQLPPVTPQPKTGHWIEERTHMICPNCSDIWHYEENQTERFKFCPTCGKGLNNESKHIRNRVRNNRTN